MPRFLALPLCLALLGVAVLSACSDRGLRNRKVRTVSSTAAAPVSSTSSSTSSTTSTSSSVPPTSQRPATSTTSRSRAPAEVRGSAPAAHASASLGTFTATCYGAFEGYGGKTASGEQSGPGSIAVDPRVIPMGTHLSAVGIGKDVGHNYAGHANDTGGAIKGARIDVWFRTAAECNAWGTRSVEVRAA